MPTKCVKCGVDIPDGAGFCPSCGTSKGAAPPPSQPVPQPVAPAPVQRPPRPKDISPFESIFDMVFSKTAIILTIIVGTLLAWIGILIATFSTGNSDIALFLNSSGFAGMGLFLAAGGIWNKKIDKYAKYNDIFGRYCKNLILNGRTAAFENYVRSKHYFERYRPALKKKKAREDYWYI